MKRQHPNAVEAQAEWSAQPGEQSVPDRMLWSKRHLPGHEGRAWPTGQSVANDAAAAAAAAATAAAVQAAATATATAAAGPRAPAQDPGSVSLDMTVGGNVSAVVAVVAAADKARAEAARQAAAAQAAAAQAATAQAAAERAQVRTATTTTKLPLPVTTWRPD